MTLYEKIKSSFENFLEMLKEKFAAKDHSHNDATDTTSGFMSAADKIKLESAEENQNAFSGIKSGEITVQANTKTDIIEFAAGTGIELEADAETKKITVTATGDAKAKTAESADKLTTPRNISITGAVTAQAVEFDGSQDITLNANSVDATKLTGVIPSANLPGYVDDVIEGYVNAGKIYEEEGHQTEIELESGKIYVDLSTNKTYRWSGTNLVEISASLALGETSSTAYRGDYGKIAYDHSQSPHAPANAEANVITEVKVNGEALVPDSKSVNIQCLTNDDFAEITKEEFLQMYSAN